jgi:Ca-activated chloride channel family protein
VIPQLTIAALAAIQTALGAEPAVRSAADERFKLWGAYSLADPWFLLLIPAGLLALAWGRSRRGRERGRVPVLVSGPVARSLAQRLAWLPTTLSAAAIVFVAIALARPLRGSIETSSQTEGVDIALLIDRSGSMRYEDMEEGQSRIDVVKTVVHDFAVRRMTDREGAADNVALIVFAAYPRLLCPFTLDVDAITGFLADLKPVENRAEDGTGIGIGLAKAVAVLKESDSKSKIVVLLTDGENNIDLITPLAAAELAVQEKVKVYTVFAGRYEFGYDMFGNLQRSQREIDPTELKQIAEKTGGRFYRARDRKDLEKIYAEIEKLERTKRVEKRWSETYDLYFAWLVPGILLHVLAWALGSTFLRRLP